MSALVSKRIEDILKDSGVDYRITEHEPVFTSEGAANVRGVDPKTGVKALVLKTPEGRFIIGLCPGDKRLDLKAISRLEGVKKLALASPIEVLKVTDCEVGSVPPFGFSKKLKTYMDKDVLDNEEVNFNIGLHTKSAAMKSKDLKDIIEPVLF